MLTDPFIIPIIKSFTLISSYLVAIVSLLLHEYQSTAYPFHVRSLWVFFFNLNLPVCIYNDLQCINVEKDSVHELTIFTTNLCGIRVYYSIKEKSWTTFRKKKSHKPADKTVSPEMGFKLSSIEEID